MPKKPVIKVRGRKMNVIHDSLWGLVGGVSVDGCKN